MIVQVNGEPHDLPGQTTVADLLALLDLDPAGRGIAVAVEAEVVPRRAWARRALTDGARVEVLTAIQGG